MATFVPTGLASITKMTWQIDTSTHGNFFLAIRVANTAKLSQQLTTNRHVNFLKFLTGVCAGVLFFFCWMLCFSFFMPEAKHNTFWNCFQNNKIYLSSLVPSHPLFSVLCNFYQIGQYCHLLIMIQWHLMLLHLLHGQYLAVQTVSIQIVFPSLLYD